MSDLNLINDNFSSINNNITSIIKSTEQLDNNVANIIKSTDQLDNKINNIEKTTEQLNNRINYYDYNDWNALGVSGQFKSGVYVDGTTVIVGTDDNGSYVTIITSSDGINWTKRSNDDIRGCLNSVTYANGIFVAVGYIYQSATDNGLIMTSSDGINWNSKTMSSVKSLYSIVFCNNKFVAVGMGINTDTGSNFCFLQSADSVSWSEKLIPGPGGASMTAFRSVIYGNNMYIAAGSYYDSTMNYIIMSSSDEMEHKNVYTGNGILYSVTYANGIIVATGESNNKVLILTSTNGTDWTEYNVNDTYGSLDYITYYNDTFIGVGNSEAKTLIATSKNGANWILKTIEFDKYFVYLIHTNNMSIAISLSELYYTLPTISYSYVTKEVLEHIYPIGAFIKLNVNTNPSTYLGFGEWTTTSDGTPYEFIRTK